MAPSQGCPCFSWDPRKSSIAMKLPAELCRCCDIAEATPLPPKGGQPGRRMGSCLIPRVLRRCPVSLPNTSSLHSVLWLMTRSQRHACSLGCDCSVHLTCVCTQNACLGRSLGEFTLARIFNRCYAAQEPETSFCYHQQQDKITEKCLKTQEPKAFSQQRQEEGKHTLRT